MRAYETKRLFILLFLFSCSVCARAQAGSRSPVRLSLNTSEADQAPFSGDVQGARYTVGYEMAVLVEIQYGRQAFNECLLDPRKLLVLYNRVAAEVNAKGATLAVWSPELLARLQAE